MFSLDCQHISKNEKEIETCSVWIVSTFLKMKKESETCSVWIEFFRNLRKFVQLILETLILTFKFQLEVTETLMRSDCTTTCYQTTTNWSDRSGMLQTLYRDQFNSPNLFSYIVPINLVKANKFYSPNSSSLTVPTLLV